MREIKNQIVVSPDGIQSGKLSAQPIPFDFEREVLSGGGFDLNVARILNKMFMQDLFPVPKGKSLFSWEDLTPHLAVTIAATYHGINQSQNRSAISSGRNFTPVNDADIDKRIARTGVMSPHEVQTRFSLGRIKIK